jgi:hypothetical protein
LVTLAKRSLDEVEDTQAGSVKLLSNKKLEIFISNKIQLN